MPAGLKKAQVSYTTFIEGVERHKDTFETVQDLAKYFNDYKRRGEVVGYVIVKNRTPGFKDYIVSGKLTVEWWAAEGYFERDFDHVNKMVDFFHEHPTIGLKVGYIPKSKHR